MCDQCHLPIDHLQTLPDRGSIDTLVALRKISSQNLADATCLSNYQQIQKMLWVPNIHVLNDDKGRDWMLWTTSSVSAAKKPQYRWPWNGLEEVVFFH